MAAFCRILITPVLLALFGAPGAWAGTVFSVTESAFSSAPLDFASLSSGTEITNQFTGVTFSGGLYRNDAVNGYLNPSSAAAVNYDPITCCNMYIWINFDAPVVRVGFDASNNPGRMVQISGPDGSMAFDAASRAFIGYESTTPFSSLTLSVVDNGLMQPVNDAFNMGRFRFDTAEESSSTPEPGSLLLFAAGSGSIVAWRCRRSLAGR